MSTAAKPDIYLEMGTGFFRIPTPQATYHITVLDFADTSATRIVEKIVEVEKKPEMAPPADNDLSHGEGEDFYQEISQEVYGEIGKLAKSLSSSMIEIPAEDRLGKRVELDEAGEKIDDAKSQLRDIVEMTEKAAMAIMDNVESVQSQTDDVRELLSQLKDHKAFQLTVDNEDSEPVAENKENVSPLAPEINEIRDDITRAKELLSAIQAGEKQKITDPLPTPEIKKEKKTRYLFDLDVVFQTLYELCTNETVKEHISGAREKAGEIFETDKFHDAISSKASSYEADADNFFSVPMSDIFASLFKACKDKGIGNLLKKMDAGQQSIFLDQTIPLEVPPTEEIETEITEEGPPSPPVPEEPPPPDPRLGEIVKIMDMDMEKLSVLEEKTTAMSSSGKFSAMTMEDQHEIFSRIEDAFTAAANICTDINRITEALSFQDLSGQQIMKIIKLLSDFQIQLLGIVVSFGSKLKHKKSNVDLTVVESEKLAQQDVDKYLQKLSPGEEQKEKILDQDTVNQMLEELGF